MILSINVNCCKVASKPRKVSWMKKTSFVKVFLKDCDIPHYRSPERSLSYFVFIFHFSNFVFNFDLHFAIVPFGWDFSFIVLILYSRVVNFIFTFCFSFTIFCFCFYFCHISEFRSLFSMLPLITIQTIPDGSCLIYCVPVWPWKGDNIIVWAFYQDLVDVERSQQGIFYGCLCCVTRFLLCFLRICLDTAWDMLLTRNSAMKLTIHLVNQR